MWRRERRRETSINVSSIESEIIGDLNECSDGIRYGQRDEQRPGEERSEERMCDR